MSGLFEQLKGGKPKKQKTVPAFFVMIFAAIGIALLLVSLAMYWYYEDGTADLDMSTPRYQPVRDQLQGQEASFESFESSGVLDKKAFTEFEKKFDTQSQAIGDAESFEPKPLSDTSIGIDLK